MLEFTEIATNFRNKSGADSKNIRGAVVPGGVLLYLCSTAPRPLNNIPDGRSLTFVPGVTIVLGNLVPLPPARAAGPVVTAPGVGAAGGLEID